MLTSAYVMSEVANVMETVANGTLTMVNVIDPQNHLSFVLCLCYVCAGLCCKKVLFVPLLFSRCS